MLPSAIVSTLYRLFNYRIAYEWSARRGGGRTMQPEDAKKLSPNDLESRKVRAELQKLVGDKVYDHWFHDKTSFRFEADHLTIGVSSPFILNWMQKSLRKELTSAARAVQGASASVKFAIDSELTQKSIDQNNSTASNNSPVKKKSSNRSGKLANNQSPVAENKKSFANGSLRRRFLDFSEFISGSGNEMALHASRQVCKEPGIKYSPLYLYAGVGLGKTHLLEGIYRKIRQEHPSLRVMLITAEVFTNYFTQALREHSLPSFRQRFRKVDVLLVDDIDFLDSKKIIQEEFLHTFKQLQDEGKQIVVASDRHPKMLMKISDELKSRLFSGLVCRIESPDLETRLKIVDFFVSKMSFSISNEAKAFVAKRFKNNIREIQGAINCLETFANMTGKTITVSATQKVLTNLERDCIRIVRMTDVEQTVCDFFGVSSEELKSKNRSRSVSQPRMLAMYLVRKHTNTAFNEIGDFFGGRNHSTVISAQRKVESMLEDNQATIKISSQSWSLGEIIESLEARLQVS